MSGLTCTWVVVVVVVLVIIVVFNISEQYVIFSVLWYVCRNFLNNTNFKSGIHFLRMSNKIQLFSAVRKWLFWHWNVSVKLSPMQITCYSNLSIFLLGTPGMWRKWACVVLCDIVRLSCLSFKTAVWDAVFLGDIWRNVVLVWGWVFFFDISRNMR